MKGRLILLGGSCRLEDKCLWITPYNHLGLSPVPGVPELPILSGLWLTKQAVLFPLKNHTQPFSGVDSVQELAPPPALPPKQRQLVSDTLPCD